MKSIKDLGPKEVIHCPTLEEAKAIVQLMKDNGGNWNWNHWDTYKEDTCYRPSAGQFCKIDFYKDKGYTIYPAADFIKNNNMTQLKIEIPDGYEVDQENSDLAKGVVKFKPIKKGLPTKWEDLGYIEGYYISTGADISSWSTLRPNKTNTNLWPTEELAKASLALCQLIRFRDIYNEDWQPDWTESSVKHVIVNRAGSIDTAAFMTIHKILSFKERQTRDLFISTFKDLLEEAKPLL